MAQDIRVGDSQAVADTKTHVTCPAVLVQIIEGAGGGSALNHRARASSTHQVTGVLVRGGRTPYKGAVLESSLLAQAETSEAVLRQLPELETSIETWSTSLTAQTANQHR